MKKFSFSLALALALALVSIISLFTIQNSYAVWNKIVDCNQGQLVIDEGPVTYGHKVYQLVLTGSPLEHLFAEGVIDAYRINEKNEFITYVAPYDSIIMVGPIGFAPGKLRIYWVEFLNSSWNNSKKDVTLHVNIGQRLESSVQVAEYKFYQCQIR